MISPRSFKLNYLHNLGIRFDFHTGTFQFIPTGPYKICVSIQVNVILFLGMVNILVRTHLFYDWLPISRYENIILCQYSDYWHRVYMWNEEFMWYNSSHVTRNPVFVTLDQVRLKPVCSLQRLARGLKSRDIILSRQRITNTLIRMRGCCSHMA